MSITAEAAIRAWVTTLPIVGEGNPLSRGAYLQEQRSPADGAYTVLARAPEGGRSVVAEDGTVNVARIVFQVYAGTEQAAELAAVALLDHIERLNGCPELCGTEAVKILVTDNRSGPFYLGLQPERENHAFQVNADFVLTAA